MNEINIFYVLTSIINFYSPGAFDQLKQNALKARIPYYGRFVGFLCKF